MQELFETCRKLREKPAHTRRSIAIALHEFARVDGPGRLGWSSHRDYCRARLGLSWGRYQAYRRCGALLSASPKWNEALLRGEVGWSIVEVAASHAHGLDFDALLPTLQGCTVTEARQVLANLESEPAPETQPRRTAPPLTTTFESAEFVRLRFALPVSVAHYADETIEVAKALLGTEAPEDQALAAIVAEASTEILPTMPAHRVDRLLAQHVVASHRRDAQATTASTPRATRPVSSGDPSRRAAVLDRAILRWLDHLRRHDAELDALLLHIAERQLHARAGFPRLVDFAAAHLDFAERTTYERRRRARLRQLHDPVSCALAQGRIHASHSELLDRLRRAGLPKSALVAWIEFAAAHTVRSLREAVHWARAQIESNARGYLLAGALPPTLDRLRTSSRSLEDVVASPDPPELATLRHSHFVVRTWTLERDTAALLAQLLGSTPSHAPAARWWSVLRVLTLARHAWAGHVTRNPHPHREVLARDRWTCAVPDCTRRNGLEVHHIRFRSAGGRDEEENLVTLCAFHHRHALHGSPATLRIRGRADRGRDSLHFRVGPVQYPSAVLHFEGERRHPMPSKAPEAQPGELPGRAISLAARTISAPPWESSAWPTF